MGENQSEHASRHHYYYQYYYLHEPEHNIPLHHNDGTEIHKQCDLPELFLQTGLILSEVPQL